MRNADPTDAFDIDQTATPAYRSASLCLLRGTASERSRGVLKYGEFRDQSIGTLSAGGYLIPQVVATTRHLPSPGRSDPWIGYRHRHGWEWE